MFKNSLIQQKQFKCFYGNHSANHRRQLMVLSLSIEQKSKRLKTVFKKSSHQKRIQTEQSEASREAKKLILLLLPNFKGSNHVTTEKNYAMLGHQLCQGSENAYVLQNQFEGCCIRKRLETTASTSFDFSFFCVFREGMNKKFMEEEFKVEMEMRIKHYSCHCH